MSASRFGRSVLTMFGLLVLLVGIAQPQVLELPASITPTSFSPLAEGHVLILDNPGRRVVELGPGFRRDIPLVALDGSRLVDVAPGPAGSVRVLDATKGTVWCVENDGRLRSRQGLFQAPTEMSVDRDGHLWVADPGAHLVLSLDETGATRRERFGPGLAATPTASELLPFLRPVPGRDGYLLAGVSSGGSVQVVSLASFEPEPGETLRELDLVGASEEEVFLQGIWGSPGKYEERVLAVRTSFEGRGRIRRLFTGPAGPVTPGIRWTYRTGPEGRVWRLDGRPGFHRLAVITPEGV